MSDFKMDEDQRIRLVVTLYCDFLNQYLSLEEKLKTPLSPSEWNECIGKMKELKRTCVDPLKSILHYLGVREVNERDKLFAIKLDDWGAGWVKGWL